MAITLFLDGEPLVGVAFLGVITAGLTLGRPAGKILAIFSLEEERNVPKVASRVCCFFLEGFAIRRAVLRS